MKKFSTLLISFLILFSSCQKDDPEATVTVEFISHTNNENVFKNSNVPIKFKASSENAEISLIELYIDGDLVSSLSGERTTWLWQTTSVDLGEHSLEIKAEDILGNTNSSKISVNVVEDVIHFNDALTYGTLEDIDGNQYKTIQIGSQTWMAEDLRTSRFRDGSNIGSTKYYDWQAVESAKNLAPEGWHVPTTAEWEILYTNLGGNPASVPKLREVGDTHWKEAEGVTNSSGFTALPYYINTGQAFYWAVPENMDEDDNAYVFTISGFIAVIGSSKDKSGLWCVRCVKD